MKLLMLLAVLLPGVALADCPTNHASSGQYDWSNSDPVWVEGIQCGGVNVNLPQGFVELSGGGGAGELSCWAGLIVSDIYQIVGPASATPIAFTARTVRSGEMQAAMGYDPYLGNICEASYVTSDLTSGATTNHFEDNSYSGCTTKAVAGTHDLALSKVPGEPFTIQFNLTVSGHGSGVIRQTLTFEGLPPGYSITSCQGYLSNPTPATATSWGSIKASYR